MKARLLLPTTVFVCLLAFTAGCSAADEQPASTASPSPTPAPTAGEAPTLEPTPTVSPHPLPSPFGTPPERLDAFRKFAPGVIQALQSGDAAFFLNRADRLTVTCRGDEEAGPCRGAPAGAMRAGISGYAWRSDAGGLFTDEDYAANLERYRTGVLPDHSDEFGDGRLRLFAIASSESPDAPTYQVITSSITDRYPSSGYHTQPFREAHAFRFHSDGDDWRFDGEIAAAAAATSVDWLSGNCPQCYDYWEPWTN